MAGAAALAGLFEARLEHCGVLRRVVEGVRELLTSTTWECDHQVVTIQGIDSSQVSMAQATLSREAFTSYYCSRPVSLAINTSSLYKVVRCWGAEDSLTITHRFDSDTIAFVSRDKDERKVSEFELRLMELREEEKVRLDNFHFLATLRLPSAEFQRIIKWAGQFEESVEISATEQGIRFHATWDSGRCRVELARSPAREEAEVREAKAVVVEMQEPLTLSYSVRYLVLFTRATPASPCVRLSMGGQAPLLVDYSLGPAGHLRFYIAPKIEDPDEPMVQG